MRGSISTYSVNTIHACGGTYLVATLNEALDDMGENGVRTTTDDDLQWNIYMYVSLKSILESHWRTKPQDLGVVHAR